jgi:hypothetical protein
MITPFSKVYDRFFSKITDDMYMELTEFDTYRLVEQLLVSAIHSFEFPRVDLTNYVLSSVTEENEIERLEGQFNEELSEEEINILATYMVVEWLGQQLASIENIRMKYSGSDFKFTSQANHMSKLTNLKEHYKQEGFHLQRLYSRRKKGADGRMHSTFSSIMGK